MVRKLALVVGGLVLLVVLALGAVVLVLQTGAASERVKNLVVPRVAAALGRDVTVEGAKLRVLPNPRVALTGTTIAGRPGEPPLAKLQSLDVQLGLWPLLRSLGKEIRVDGVTLVRPEVNLVRAKDGTWNYEGLGGKQPPPAQAGAQQPAAQGQGAKVFVAQARIEDGALRFVDASQGKHDAAVALTKIDVDAEGGVGAKLAAKLTAALAGDQKNVALELASPHVPEKIGPGSYPELTGRLQLTAIPLQRLRGLLPANVAQMFTGGRVDCDAKVSSEPGAVAYRLDGDGKLADVKLRGEPASGSFALHARVDPATGGAKAEVTKLAVKGPGVDLGGTASLDAPKGGPVRARFAIAGPLLDLGAVLGLVPQGPKPAQPPPEAQGGALLPPAMAREVEQLDVRGTLDIAKVVNGKLTATDVKAQALLKGGVFSIEQATAGLYGGRLDAGGTRVDLADPYPKWNLKARLDAVDLAQAFAAVTGASPLQGKATGSLDLAGVGSNWDALKKVLTGLGAISLKQGTLTTKDLGGDALGAVAQGLQKLGKGGLASKAASLEGGKTTLRDLAASFTVKDGFLALAKPLAFDTPAGAARLGGKIGLSEELALEGSFQIPKQVLARTGLPLATAIELPMKLGGTLTAPAPSFDASGALAGAARGIVAEKKQQLQDEATRQARKGAEDLLRRLGR